MKLFLLLLLAPFLVCGQGFIINPYLVEAAGGEPTTNTTTYTWTFASSLEELGDAGTNANVVCQHDSGDGNPSGALQWECISKNHTGSNWAKTNGTGSTWITLGVPSGATVLSVRLTDWETKVLAVANLGSHSCQFDVIANDNTVVHSAGSLTNFTLPTSTDGSFVSRGAAPMRDVDGSYQAASTGIRFQMRYDVTTTGPSGGLDVRTDFDNIDLEITYYQ
jgi:hypothetical protein